MRVVIKIECDTINELATHLNVIKSQIKKEAKKRKLQPHFADFPTTVNISDDNCYGEHTLNIYHTK